MVRNLIRAVAFLNWIRSSASPSMRWIGGGRGVHVDVQVLCNIDSRRIAVAIWVVVRWTTCRNYGPLWRLGKLPHFGKGNSGVSGARRSLGKSTAGRRRTGIVRDPVRDLSCAGVLADIVRCHDIFATLFCRRNAGAINSGAEAARGDSVHPGVNVGFLLRQHSATLFLVKKDDRLR